MAPLEMWMRQMEMWMRQMDPPESMNIGVGDLKQATDHTYHCPEPMNTYECPG
jgi:hypothetical protein